MLQQHSPSSYLHSYGTRTRKNSILKPSARLRQPSPPPPRKIKPVPVPVAIRPVPPTPDPCLPVFPLPGVMLHQEDASNKVFHAIGRSFLAVENRAMTIKDLAEMTLKYGLMCQNVSAASQAITTYIRNHMARCEAQQDHPLLLRHVLSGTLSDDDLVPALHSRRGGATNPTKPSSKDPACHEESASQMSQGTLEGERLTNFRRGTMVWYLSKAAGVSCPFARAGIRLCEYGKDGRRLAENHGDVSQPSPKKITSCDGAQCGEKRKRVRRGCRRDSDGSQDRSIDSSIDSQSPAIDSGYGEMSTDSSDDERPPKVKLTLRLRPTLSRPPTSATAEVIDLSSDVTGSSPDDDADMRLPDVPWSLPPYPRRSISVPCYTPTCDERPHSPSFPAYHRAAADERRRSPSVPWSASPPPDSDHDDFDLDFDSDVDWDSSSLSVPSPAPAPRVKVESTDDIEPFKQEPSGIRDMLDAWEDLDYAPTTVSSATVKLPTTDDLQSDALELWEWEFEGGWTGIPEDQDLPIVKMEPDERASVQTLLHGFPVSPHSPFSPSSYHSSSPISEPGVGSFTFHSPLSPFTLSTLPSLPSLPTGINRGGCSLTWQDAELLGPDSVHPHEFEDGWTSEARMLPQPAIVEAVSSSPVESKQDTSSALVKEIESECEVPQSQSSSIVASDVVVVRTCRPCTPDIYATQVEDIPVYRTMLGAHLLLRRIDTDFVNLSTILSYLSLPPPSPLHHACVTVCHASLSIDGIWAPLSVARMYGHGLPNETESIFLSDDLVMHFPTALQDFYQKSTSGRLLNQFGPSFHTSFSSPLRGPQLDHERSAKEDAWGPSIEAGLVEEPLLAIPPAVNLALAALHPSASTEVAAGMAEVPLSPTEQEIFRVLCVHPDWETEEEGITGGEGKADAAAETSSPRERPLRRSRRVADAVAARSRAAPPRTKGARHS